MAAMMAASAGGDGQRLDKTPIDPAAIHCGGVPHPFVKRRTAPLNSPEFGTVLASASFNRPGEQRDNVVPCVRVLQVTT